MIFHTWTTLVEEAGRLHSKEWRKKPLPQQYADELQALIEYPFRQEDTRTKRLIRLALEVDWTRSGKPYYNIHPQMAKQLAKTNLDSIPARYIEIPNDYRCIHIRFSEDMPIRIRDGSQPFHFVTAPEVQQSGLGFRSVLFGRFNFDDEKFVQQNMPSMIGEDIFVLIVDEGFRVEIPNEETGQPVQRMLCNLIKVGIRSNETIPQAFERAIDEAGEMDTIMLLAMKERLMNLFRVVVTTGFLANCTEDQLVTPDILSKDQRKYEEAVKRDDQTAITAIVERSQRRGKLGWNVGTDEIFAGTSVVQPRNESTGRGKELQWSHIRSGHPHAVRFGPQKSKVKIKWFRPTRVREDLPFKEEQ